jgi:hypothetical protein
MQVSKIRYLPPKRVSTNTGITTYPGCFRGLVYSKDEEDVEFVNLTNEWINENIQPGMIKLTKEMAMQGGRNFVRIPEGFNENQVASAAVVASPDAPRLKYWFRRSQGRERYCVTDSAASALCYVGLEHIAHRVLNGLQSKEFQTTPMKYVFNVIMKNRTKEDRKRFDVCFLSGKKARTHDILIHSTEIILGIYSIFAEDGKTDHSISIVGQWIFDSNFENALPLSRESLNICSSSDDRKTDYVGIVFGCILKKNKNYVPK